MKNVFVYLLMAAFFMPLRAQDPKKIVILHTNDLHSRLMGYAPESAYTPLTINDDETAGGFARIASVLDRERKGSKGIVLTVDGGDFLMGTLFQGLEVKTGFQLRLMKDMGYDVMCLGNHEFDYGPSKLADIISSGLKGGDIPPLLLSNAQFDENDTDDDKLEDLFDSNIIGRKYIIERDGLKFGFFSLLGEVADDNAAFAPPVTFSNQVRTAKKMVKELQAQNCDLIICLSHSGVTAVEVNGWSGEDVILAEKVKGLNALISGHTHTKLEKPVIVNGVPVVQTGSYGKYVGKLTLTYADGNVRYEDYELIPVDDSIEGDAVINAAIDKQKEAVSKEILEPINIKYNEPVAETGFTLVCDEGGDIENSNLGPLVADAIHSYINRHSEKGTDVSMVAVGVIRESILPGVQTAPDIFNIMSMGEGSDNVPGYPLARVYVTGRELKSILEILMVAGKSTPSNYCYYSGLKAGFDPGKGLLRKISKIEIISPGGESKTVDFSKKNKELYSITANSYMLEFVGIIKKMTFGLINVVPKDINGNAITDTSTTVIDIDGSREGIQEGKEWLALFEYLSLMNDNDGNGIPDIETKYKSSVKTFYNINNTTRN